MQKCPWTTNPGQPLAGDTHPGPTLSLACERRLATLAPWVTKSNWGTVQSLRGSIQQMAEMANMPHGVSLMQNGYGMVKCVKIMLKLFATPGVLWDRRIQTYVHLCKRIRTGRDPTTTPHSPKTYYFLMAPEFGHTQDCLLKYGSVAPRYRMAY
eukprot:502209-Karenia_brevis.AAC.1